MLEIETLSGALASGLIEMSSTGNRVFWGQYIWDRAHIAVFVTVGDRDSPRIISDL